MENRIPDEFIALMCSTFGEQEGRELVKGLDLPPLPGAVRLNPLKQLEEMPFWMDGAEKIEWCKNGYRLKEGSDRPNFTHSPQMHSGAFYVQDAASMVIENIVSEICTEIKPERVLDLCAAPGGKTTAALSQLPPDTLMVANEYDAQRANILKENVEKWGRQNVIVTQDDTSWVKAFPETFDIVIADVPCSGEGMMRKDAQARKQWTLGLVRQCSELQRDIVSNAVKALRKHGYLIYSTCTFNKLENEKNVEWMAREYGLDILYTRRFAPHTTGTEGLFVCVMRKKPYVDPCAFNYIFKRDVKIKPLKRCKASLIPWIDTKSTGGEMCFMEHKGTISMIGEKHLSLAENIMRHTKVLALGTEVGIIKQKGVVPLHGSAMSTLLKRDYFPEIELSSIQALRYLARSVVQINLPDRKGYHIVTFAGLPLGFINNLGTRFNNMYPQNYRIRNLYSI